MIHNTIIKKLSGRPYKPQIKKVREQPRHKIRSLLRSFEPLETFKNANKASLETASINSPFNNKSQVPVSRR